MIKQFDKLLKQIKQRNFLESRLENIIKKGVVKWGENKRKIKENCKKLNRKKGGNIK